ncbi:Crp/Fnr family transcriptional regulator [Cohnella lupini]|uniref:CRP-like cAMP-binding protein n=1 Tax=Cohnella lupini TaxID=1294267 RepID=A0A3D9I8L7_9BACL|nr:Crp/Fnr family transcriptional regulator [Cohnella lupini]RED58041.1 CRP-like cAMP-binding protein [Cohnella lupini]
MAVVAIESVRVKMRVGRDVYSAAGVKLFTSGTVLTKENLLMLKRHNVKRIEVDESSGQLPERKLYSPAMPSSVRAREETALSRYHSLVKNVSLFANVSDKQLGTLASNFRLERHAANTTLFRERDPGNYLFLVLSGSIRTFTQSPFGRIESEALYLQAGDSFGELSILDAKPRAVSALTLEETEIFVLSRENILKVMKSDFEIAKRIMKEMNNLTYSTKQHLEELSGLDSRSRVVRCLVNLTNHFGKRTDYSVEVDLPLELNELAQMAGVGLNELHDVIDQLEQKRMLKMHAHYFALNLQQMRI